MKKMLVVLLFVCPAVHAQRFAPCVGGPTDGARLALPRARLESSEASAIVSDSAPVSNPDCGQEQTIFIPQQLHALNLNVRSFGAKGDTRVANDGMVSPATSNVITSSSLNFTAADVGKTIWASNGSLVLPVSATPGGAAQSNSTTIVSVISSTQATISGYWNTSGSTITNASVTVGDDDTAGIVAAINAALTQSGAGGCVFIPAGNYMVRANLANTNSSQSLCLFGASSATTTIFLNPDLSYNYPAGGFGVVLNLMGSVVMGGLTIEAQGIIVNSDSEYLVNLYGPVVILSDLAVQNWITSGNNNAAIDIGSDYATLYSVRAQGNGPTSLIVHSNFTECFSCLFSSYTAAVVISDGVHQSFFGGSFSGLGTNGVGFHVLAATGPVQNGLVMGAEISGAPGQPAVMIESQSHPSQYTFVSDSILAMNSNSTGIDMTNCSPSSCTVTVSTSIVQSSGTGVAFNNSATLIDGGGNQVQGSETGPGIFVNDCP